MTTSNMRCSRSRLFPGAMVARSGREDCGGSGTINVWSYLTVSCHVAHMVSRWVLRQRYSEVISVAGGLSLWARGSTLIAWGWISICLSIQQSTGAQRPYRPVNVAFAKVWKCRSNPTSAAEAASFLASGILSTSTANTVIW